MEGNEGSHCQNVDVLFENKEVEDLYFNILLKKDLSERINTFISGRYNKNNANRSMNSTCILLIDVQKSYINSLIGSDGNISAKNARYHIKYSLDMGEKMLKKNNFLLFYNINVSKYQYSNKVLLGKGSENNVNKISKKIFSNIKKYM
jgi:hypothetical protein